MITFPEKRILALIGPPRSGKDKVAGFLQETRNFATFAFADKIKEEFGISKEEFEVMKTSGEIKKLRKQLWEFSASKKAADPLYFIRKVIDEVVGISGSAVITDIRTMDELNSFLNCLKTCGYTGRLYYVEKWSSDSDTDNSDIILDTEIPFSCVAGLKETDQLRTIINPNNGLYNFMLKLEEFFFTEDIFDLLSLKNNTISRRLVRDYISQFKISPNYVI